VQSSNTSHHRTNPVQQLFDAIKSGDLTTAKAAYQQLLANAPSSSSTKFGTSSSATDATSGSSANPLQQLLDQIGTALQSGDISSAQSSLSQFLSSASPPPPPPGNGPDSSTGQALSSLFSSIQSGDLTSAQSAYASLQSLLGGASDGASSSTSSSTDATSTSSSSGSGKDLFLQLLDNIGTDLSNNDLTSAQTALSNFSKGASSGLAYNYYA
jgi:hypothetical protein